MNDNDELQAEIDRLKGINAWLHKKASSGHSHKAWDDLERRAETAEAQLAKIRTGARYEYGFEYGEQLFAALSNTQTRKEAPNE